MKKFLALLFGVLAPVIACAQGLPQAPCTGLIGCGAEASNIAASSLGKIAGIALDIASASSVLLIVWSGFNMIIALGDEGKASQFKWGVVNAILGLGIAISSSALVTFVGTENYGQGADPDSLLTVAFASAIRIIVTLVNVSMMLAIIIAGMRLFYAQGKSEDQSKAKHMITWAVGGAVVVNLANALVTAFANIVGL